MSVAAPTARGHRVSHPGSPNKLLKPLFRHRAHQLVKLTAAGHAVWTHKAVSAARTSNGLSCPSTAAQWARAVLADPRLTARADRVANLSRVVAVLAGHGDDRLLITRPTHDRIAEVVGCSLRTVGRIIVSLKATGWLITLEEGQAAGTNTNTTVPYAQMNVAACYALATPLELNPVADRPHCASSKPVTVRPTPRSGGLGRRLSTTPLKKTSVNNHSHRYTQLRGAARREQKAPLRGKLAGAAQIINAVIPLRSRRVSRAKVGAVITVFWAAGWTADDILYALNYLPDGRKWAGLDKVHSPIGWMRTRLNYWLWPDTGNPMPSHSQIRDLRNQQAADTRQKQVLEGQAIKTQFEQTNLDSPGRRAWRDATRTGLTGSLWRAEFEQRLALYDEQGEAAELGDLANPPELEHRWPSSDVG